MLAGLFRAGEKSCLVEVLQDELAHRLAAVVLGAEHLDTVTAFAQQRESEVRQPVLHPIQVAADRPDRDLQPARQCPRLYRFVRTEQHPEQRYPPLLWCARQGTHLAQRFQRLRSRGSRSFNLYPPPRLPHERESARVEVLGDGLQLTVDCSRAYAEPVREIGDCKSRGVAQQGSDQPYLADREPHRTMSRLLRCAPYTRADEISSISSSYLGLPRKLSTETWRAPGSFWCALSVRSLCVMTTSASSGMWFIAVFLTSMSDRPAFCALLRNWDVPIALDPIPASQAKMILLSRE